MSKFDSPVLVVEGSVDRAVVACLAEDLKIGIRVEVGGGYPNCINVFAQFMKSDSPTAVGLLVDADKSLTERMEEVVRLLGNKVPGLETAGLEPRTSQCFAVNSLRAKLVAGKVRADVAVIGGLDGAGSIEDFVLDATEADECTLHAHEVVDSLPAGVGRFAPRLRKKSVFHTVVAWQSNPGAQCGRYAAGLLHAATSECSKELLAWLVAFANGRRG